MIITVERYDERPTTHDNVDQFAAATHNFPYWTLWEPEIDGHQQVYYYNKDSVTKISIYGEVEKEGEINRKISEHSLPSLQRQH